MDFSFSDEQLAVRDLARQILADACQPEHLRALEAKETGDGIDHALWGALADANLLGVALGEDYGGSDLGLLALCMLLEEVGRHVAPLPLIPTLIYAALPIEAFASQEQRQRFLPGIARGEIILSAALQELGSGDPARPRTQAHADGTGFVLRGEKVCVPAAQSALRILVPARVGDDAVGLFWVDPRSPGVTLARATTTNHEVQFLMQLEGVAVPGEDVLGDPADGADTVRWIVDRAQLALSAVQLGVASAALARTAEYVSTRKQFGRAIGTFQAVAMRAADAFIDIESMRSTLWQAAWRLEAGLPAGAEIAAAKWWACRAGQRVVHAAQHLHGGIGADIDYPIHRYFLWARQLETTLGGASHQLARIGALIAAEARQAPSASAP